MGDEPATAVSGATRPRLLWKRARLETNLSYVVAGAALAAGILILGDEIGRHIDELEAWIAGLGPWAPAVFVLLYALLGSLFVPDLLFGVVAGASFGFTRGVVVAAAGSLAGAALQ